MGKGQEVPNSKVTQTGDGSTGWVARRQAPAPLNPHVIRVRALLYQLDLLTLLPLDSALFWVAFSSCLDCCRPPPCSLGSHLASGLLPAARGAWSWYSCAPKSQWVPSHFDEIPSLLPQRLVLRVPPHLTAMTTPQPSHSCHWRRKQMGSHS